MHLLGAIVVAVVMVVAMAAEEKEVDQVREKRSAPSYGHGQRTYEKQTYEKKRYYKTKECYQCAYSPPKTYYDKRVYVEQKHYGQSRYATNTHGSQGYGQGGATNNNRQGHYGGYTKKTEVPVPYTVNGGWDKCIGPFTHYEAKHYGIDEWDCHSNCYTRRDRNGDVFRGCYKGEFGVNPYRLGCHKQAGSVYCFCDGDKCNNGPSPH